MESSSFWNPESTVLESGIQYPESGIHSMESRIQDCPGFPYMGRKYLIIPNFCAKFQPNRLTTTFGPWNTFSDNDT